MKNIIISIISLCLIGLFLNVSVNAQNRTNYAVVAPESAGVLIARKTGTNKQFAFMANMEVQYWLRLTNKHYPLVGVIEDFKEDTIIISGREIPLKGLIAIKKVDKRSHNAFKVIGPVLGIAGAAAGTLGGLIMISWAGGEPHLWAPPFLIAGVSLYAGFIPVAKGSKKFHVSNSNFKIIFTEPRNFISKKMRK